ncbi:hypothetical protein [Lentimicrobium sp. S6]|uniref:hypothetical protein n=1 Tax=Lentimicrobium sp. S6 TaxID=2735872 RepID=UPI0015556740|nr:hypothetical protein [Lentimicrobium sp. S6]NPD47243.1 hypothetical protein [Lentimicrobium sp. S6]
MKIKLIILLLVFSVSNIFAQTDSVNLRQRISDLEVELVKQQKKLDNFYKELDKEYRTYKFLQQEFKNSNSLQKLTIDSLKQVVNTNSKNVQTTAEELGVKIDDTHKVTSQSIMSMNRAVNNNTLYWIIAFLVIALFVLLVFVFLRKQIFKQKTDLDSNLHETRKVFEKENEKLDANIQETRKVLDEESVKLDNKLIEVLETQLKIIDRSNSVTENEADHTFALKIADEIVRIEKNITKIDRNTKGIKPLSKGIERIKDNFKANGYEMVQLLDSEYDDGMNIDVINFVDDDSLTQGKKIITRIIKPQVNYQDKLIQRAQVDVSQN